MVHKNGRFQSLIKTLTPSKLPCALFALGVSLPLQASATVQYSDSMEVSFGNWSNVTTGDNKNWLRDSHGTPSYNTGPNTGSNGSTFYAYLETSSGSAYNAGDSAILEGPSISGMNVRIAFDYHMFGSTMGALAIDVLENNQWTEDVWMVSGQKHSSSGSSYTQADVDLSAYNPSKIRFRATAIGGYTGDMAIDNITITSEPAGPVAPIFLTSNLTKVIGREGHDYQDSLAQDATDANGDGLTFSKVSGPEWLVVADDGSLSGVPGTNDVGNNTFIVQVSDGALSSTASLAITVVEINAPVLVNESDFELSSGSDFGFWANVTSGDNKNWIRDSAGTPSSATGPNTGAANSDYYVYLETSSGGAYNAGDNAILTSTEFPASSALLNFDYHMYGANIGSLAVDVFAATGWVNDVWTISGQQQLRQSDDYLSAEVDLSVYEITKIRFRATAVGGYMGDMALDNIKIYQIDPATTDSDNDGITNGQDLCPQTPVGETVNVDGCALSQLDSDGDGVSDLLDAFPNDSNEWADFDGDGFGNNTDNDDDNDGVLDVNDDLPFNANETVDTDGDGLGNNADNDDDNDGVADALDAFPLDSAESVDTDADGLGNNADTDDDNDGVQDVQDAFPLDASESLDTDLDGMGNNADLDDDNDGVQDNADAFPLNANEYLDTDLDGLGNNADLDDDNDGLSDLDEMNLHQSNPLSADSDNDGMDDGWEVLHGLLVNTNDAAGDNNYNGMTNLDEYVAGNDPSSPIVITTSPATNELDVSGSAIVEVRFSESIDASSISAASFELSDGVTNIDGSFSLSDLDGEANRVARFTPSSALSPGAQYTVTLYQSVMDLAGNSLQADYQWSFTVINSYSLTGSILNQGQALGNVNLAISSLDHSGLPVVNTVSDASGNYSVDGLVPGNYRVTPELTGYSFSPVLLDVQIADASITGLAFQAGGVSVIQVPGDYLTIQAAIDNAIAGATIVVSDGTYSENILIDKPLSLTSENGSDTTLITAANENQHVVMVSAENVSISGFDISGATTYYKAGIYFASGSHYGKASDNKCGYDDAHRNYIGISSFESDYLEISNNECNHWGPLGIHLEASIGSKVIANTVIRHNIGGIVLDNCDTCVVSDNYLLGNSTGIRVIAGKDNIITKNSSRSNTDIGIEIKSSGHVVISHNEVRTNNNNGIYINNSSTSSILNNSVNFSGVGIYLESSGISEIMENTIENSGSSGIAVYSTNNSHVSDNTLISNNYGIYLNSSSNVQVTDNVLSRNDSGIRLNYSNNNEILRNSTIANRYGIELSSSDINLIRDNHFSTPVTGFAAYGAYAMRSKDNVFYLNYFKGSASGAAVKSNNGSINAWVSPASLTYEYKGGSYTGFMGNHYAEHNSQDNNGDGIADSNWVLPADEPVATYPLIEALDQYLVQ